MLTYRQSRDLQRRSDTHFRTVSHDVDTSKSGTLSYAGGFPWEETAGNCLTLTVSSHVLLQDPELGNAVLKQALESEDKRPRSPCGHPRTVVLMTTLQISVVGCSRTRTSAMPECTSICWARMPGISSPRTLHPEAPVRLPLCVCWD